MLKKLLFISLLPLVTIMFVPASVAFGQEKETLEGEFLLVIMDDFDQGEADEEVLLLTEESEIFELEVSGLTSPEEYVDTMVRVTGNLEEDVLVVKSTRSKDFKELDESLITERSLPISQAALRAPVAIPVFAGSVDIDKVTTGGIGVKNEDTFYLHSKPNATHKIFLDFDGHLTRNPVWQRFFGAKDVVSVAFSKDADRSSFSEADLAAIQQVWQRVAEYYAAFNIDVTTEDPGVAGLLRSNQSDNQFGTRIVITSDNRRSVGGVAAMHSFDSNIDTPAYVFSNRLGGSVANIAMAAGHEIGHTLGLGHDGATVGGKFSEYYTGHGVWAPLMGAGYGKSIHHFSRGEYYEAENLQDDFRTIVTDWRGIKYAKDEAGSSQSNAKPLSGSTTADITTVSEWGIISGSAPNNDVDVYSFPVGSGGKVNISVVPTGRSYSSTNNNYVYRPLAQAMLDIEATISDATGKQIARVNDSNQSALINLSGLTPGVYYLTIDGVGTGNPMSSKPTGYTEYGSVGQYLISGTYSAGVAPANENPMVSLLATPVTVVGSQTTTLSWSTSGAAACTASGAWSGSKVLNGSEVLSPTTSSTYTLTCTNAKGSTQSSVTVTVDKPNNVSIEYFTADPTTVKAGGISSTLRWSTKDATHCKGKRAWSGNKPLSGEEKVTVDATSTYELECQGQGSGGGGSKRTALVTVTVGQGQGQATQTRPTITLTASPASITTGQSSTLTWSSVNATTCTASGGWSGTKTTSGTQSVSPTVTTTYTLSCTGAGGTSVVSTIVTVGSATPKPTITLTASPASITTGQSSTLTWSSVNATTCTASGGWSGTKTTSGTQSVSPTVTTTYALSCTGAGGSTNNSVTVTVSTGGGDDGRTITPPPSHSRGFKINIGATEVNLLATIPPPPPPTITSTPKAASPQLVGTTGVDVFQALDFSGNPAYLSKGGNDVFYMPNSAISVKELDSSADTTAVLTLTRGAYNLPTDIKTLLFSVPDARGGSHKGNDLDNVMITTATPAPQAGRLVFNGRLGDDIIVLGSAIVDEIVIDADAGTDTIINFNTAVSKGDIVRLYPGAFVSYRELKASLRAVGSDTVLVLKNGEELWFKNVAPAAFAPSHFVKLSSDWVAFNGTYGRVLGASTDTLRLTERLSLRPSGEEVRLVQDVLRLLGYYDDLSTGYFGPKTEAAIKVFQSEHGLEALGIVGPLTRALLNGVLEV